MHLHMIYVLKFSQNFSFNKALAFFGLIFCFCFNFVSAIEPSDEALKSRILYLLKAGKETFALELYQDFYKLKSRHDADLLEQIATIIIEQGFYSDSAESQVLSIFGAGISNNEKMLGVLKAGISSRQPEIQLISLNFLSAFHHDDADRALKQAMNSDHLLIRLEAGIHLAEQKSPVIASQIESLMNKVDEALYPLFPQFFALIGTQEAIKTLSRMLNHRLEKVRVQAIISAANHNRDDLSPIIRKLSSQTSALQQEATAYAFGIMKDETSIPRLEVLALSNSENVKLSSLLALYRLGQKHRQTEIETLAKNLDLFAIYMLSEMEGSEPLLKSLSRHEDLNVRVNAAIALLKSKNPQSSPSLMEVLIRDSRDLAFLETRSIGSSLKALKSTPSASQNFKDNEIMHEIALSMREDILTKASKLPEMEFLRIAKTILDMQQNELVPRVTYLIENLQTKESIELLKTYSQKAGAPLIRNYCNLALFRLKEPGHYRENLEAFVLKEYKTDLIQFRQFLPFEMRAKGSEYQLTPRDTSRLLVEVFEALTLRQDEQGINTLLYAIQHGNSNNKYALAGLLMHAVR